jgi:glycosyltransferase involved in cell wall biosynthesis
MQPVRIVVTELYEIQEIEWAVTSLLAQQPPAAEVIVVDGGSTDGTWEWLQQAQRLDPRLAAIRDETCSLKFSKGSVSRGRNVAIAAARTRIVACADACCRYAPDWLSNLTAPLASGAAECALGGSCLDPEGYTAWDVASAPFFSVKLEPTEPIKSCTARAMAFTKDLWQRIGGFPEQVLVGEDTLFDLEARRLAAPAFVANAKALYRPRNSFRSATLQMARYATSDGQAGVRWARMFRKTRRAACCRWPRSLVSGGRFSASGGGASARVLVRLPSQLALFAALRRRGHSGTPDLLGNRALDSRRQPDPWPLQRQTAHQLAQHGQLTPRRGNPPHFLPAILHTVSPGLPIIKRSQENCRLPASSRAEHAAIEAAIVRERS